MAEIRETHVERRRGRGGLFVLTFLVGAFLIAAVVVVLMNVQGTLSWPAGRVDFSLRPTASQPANPPVTATAQNAGPTQTIESPTPSAATSETPAAPSDEAPSTAGEQPSATEPAETATPQ